jgi:methanogenic corrinoid protein MtbC1
VTQDFADMIGADGYAPDAASAVEAARQALRAG